MKILRNILIAGAIVQLAAVALVKGDNKIEPGGDSTPGMQVIQRDGQMVISSLPGSNRRAARIASSPVYRHAEEYDTPECVRVVEAPAASGPERECDRVLETPSYRTAWREGSEHEYTFSAGEWHARYIALFDTGGVATITGRSGDGVKQSFILNGPGAPSELAWRIETNARVTPIHGGLDFSGGTGETVFMVPPPLAWDADGSPVRAEGSYDPETMIYRITVETAGAAWPVTVDPSTMVQSRTDGQTYIYNFPEYAAARGLNMAYTLSSLLAVGQRDDGYHDGYRHYALYRSFLSFPVPEMFGALACTLFVDGWDNNSEVDFDVWVIGAEAYGPVLDGGDFKRFDGWRSSGIYNATRLNDIWNSASWNAGWNAITFRTEGLDSLFAAAGDTLRIALISAEDIGNSPPAADPGSNEELVSFESSAQAHSPYLSLSYVAPGPPLTPADMSVTDAGPDWLDAIATTADAYTDSILWYIGDVLDGATAYPDTTYRFGGLTPATVYQLRATAKNQYGASALSSPVQASTPPRTPGIMSIQPLSPHSLQFILDPLDNPSWVEYALQDSVSGQYVDGEASPDTLRNGPPGDWGWRTFGGWGAGAGDTLVRLMPDSLYVFRAKARD